MQPTTRQWTIDGITREAALYIPPTAKTDPAPLVFAFHGHGGTIETYSARVFFPPPGRRPSSSTPRASTPPAGSPTTKAKPPAGKPSPANKMTATSNSSTPCSRT